MKRSTAVKLGMPAVAVVAGLSLAACGSIKPTGAPAVPVATHQAPGGNPATGVTTPADPGTATPADNTTGPVGQEFTYTGGDGTAYTIKLVKVADPATGANEFYTPDVGKRFVGAEFVLTETAGTLSDDANNDASVQGGDGQMYTPDVSSISAGTNFNSGMINLHPGKSVTGWVAFQVPSGVKVSNVQWTPSSGFSDVTCTWTVS
jgi:hypothetical protein